MKKLIALLLAMLMVLGMFAGCSGDQSDATEPSADVSEDTTPSAPSSGKDPVTISWWAYEDEVVTPIFKKWLEKFHAKYDWITIEVTYLPWDTGPEKQTIAFATRNVPDIMGDTYGRLAPAVDSGLTISLEPVIKEVPGLTSGMEGIIDGEHHYMWQGASVGYAVACNMDLAAELGVLDYLPEDGLTWTWDDFLYCLRAAKEAGYYGVDMYAASQSSDMWYYSWLLGEGVEIIDPAAGVLVANNEQYRETALKVLKFLKQIVDEQLCQPGAATMVDTDVSPLWDGGQLLFTHCGWNNSAGFRVAYDQGTSYVENFEMFAIPTSDGKVGGGDCGAFSSSGVIAFDTNNGKNLEAVYEALKFYHSEEGGYFQGTQDAAPSGTSILDWVQINPENMHPIDVTNLIERGGPYSVQHARADWGPGYGWYADFRMCWFPQFSSYLGGYITAEEMLDNWELNTNAAIAKYVEENS